MTLHHLPAALAPPRECHKTQGHALYSRLSAPGSVMAPVFERWVATVWRRGPSDTRSSAERPLDAERAADRASSAITVSFGMVPPEVDGPSRPPITSDVSGPRASLKGGVSGSAGQKDAAPSATGGARKARGPPSLRPGRGLPGRCPPRRQPGDHHAHQAQHPTEDLHGCGKFPEEQGRQHQH